VAESRAETEYERFFAVAKRSLMAQAFLLTGDVEESRDLVQEVLFRAWRQWSRVGSYDDPLGWARRVLHNLAIGRWRRERSRRRFHAEPNAAVASPPDVGHLDVIEALHRLPEHHQRALVLHDVAGLTVVEVAAELEAPEGTVRSWLSRGRTALASDLGLMRAPAGEGAE
jgi:RNA polymerase sigma-70 factor (ECF subfamily)